MEMRYRRGKVTNGQMETYACKLYTTHTHTHTHTHTQFYVAGRTDLFRHVFIQ